MGQLSINGCIFPWFFRVEIGRTWVQTSDEIQGLRHQELDCTNRSQQAWRVEQQKIPILTDEYMI